MRSAFATFFANSGFAIYIYILIYIHICICNIYIMSVCTRPETKDICFMGTCISEHWESSYLIID